MPLNPAARSFGFLLAIAAAISAFAQVRPLDNRPRNCSLSGRITVGGQSAVNAQVAILELPPPADGKTPTRGIAEMETFKAATDADGFYRVQAMPAGRYRVRARLLAFVPANNSLSRSLGKDVTLDDGEAREGVDFALVRGGVITGRVTNAEGKPLIGFRINAMHVDTERRQIGGEEAPLFGEMLETDDRGVYRLYGLPAGRYLISAGDSRVPGILGDGAVRYQRTFHPDTADAKQAKIIEVKEGSEITDVDIRLGLPDKNFEAAGRVVDGDTGGPIAGVTLFAYSQASEAGNNAATDADGAFRITGLVPGKYQLSASFIGSYDSSDYYFERIPFEIGDGNVSSLELKARRGGSISGVVVIEGSNDPALRAQLKKTEVYARVSSNPRFSDAVSSSRAQPDDGGGFRLRGVAQGFVSITFRNNAVPGLSLLRIEKNGAEVRDGFEFGKGEQATGLRIMLGVADGRIRGEAKLTGGSLPEGWTLRIEVWRDGRQQTSTRPDDKGRFLLTNLLEGEYELKLNARSNSPATSNQPAPFGPVTQRVVVPKGGEAQVTITADLGGKQEER